MTDDLIKRLHARKIDHDPYGTAGTVPVNPDGPEAHRTIEALTTRAKELEARLEITHYSVTDAVTGEVTRRELTDEERKTFPDGIACRDATIELLEDRMKELKAENRELAMQALAASGQAQHHEGGLPMTDAPKLKPCPFCGGEANLCTKERPYPWIAKCDECGATAGGSAYRNDTWNAYCWNTRADLIDMDVLRRVEKALSRQHTWHLAQTDPVDMGGVEVIPAEAYVESHMFDETYDTLTDLRRMIEALK